MLFFTKRMRTRIALFRKPVVVLLLKLQATKTEGTCKPTHLLSGDTVAVNRVISPDGWFRLAPLAARPQPSFPISSLGMGCGFTNNCQEAPPRQQPCEHARAQGDQPLRGEEWEILQWVLARPMSSA